MCVASRVVSRVKNTDNGQAACRSRMKSRVSNTAQIIIIIIVGTMMPSMITNHLEHSSNNRTRQFIHFIVLYTHLTSHSLFPRISLSHSSISPLSLSLSIYLSIYLSLYLSISFSFLFQSPSLFYFHVRVHVHVHVFMFMFMFIFKTMLMFGTMFMFMFMIMCMIIHSN